MKKRKSLIDEDEFRQHISDAIDEQKDMFPYVEEWEVAEEVQEVLRKDLELVANHLMARCCAFADKRGGIDKKQPPKRTPVARKELKVEDVINGWKSIEQQELL